MNFHEHGFLPIFFVVTNDGDQPISIANMHVTLTTANRSKLTPASPEDIYRRITNPRANTDPPEPIPIPHKKVKGTSARKKETKSNPRNSPPKPSSPTTPNPDSSSSMSKTSPRPLAGAHIYVTGVNDAKGTELMYF